MSYLSQDQVHHTAPQEQDPCTLATGGVRGCGQIDCKWPVEKMVNKISVMLAVP